MIGRVLVIGLLLALGTLVAIGSRLFSTSFASEGRSSEGRAPDFPALFEPARACPHDAFAGRAAARAEFQGILLAERYPYDPRDGVRAVHRFQEAQSCYEASGVQDGARRTGRLATRLATRIEIDYASSRLALESAMAADKWSVAQGELLKLLRLTEHRRGHPFVEYLIRVAGKVAIRASTVR